MSWALLVIYLGISRLIRVNYDIPTFVCCVLWVPLLGSYPRRRAAAISQDYYGSSHSSGSDCCASVLWSRYRVACCLAVKYTLCGSHPTELLSTKLPLRGIFCCIKNKLYFRRVLLSLRIR